MSYSTYLMIRQIIMGLLIFIGLHMLLVRLPKHVRGTFYQRSKRVMGVAFLIVPISCFLYTENNQLDLKPYISTAINLTAYFSTFVLMSVAFLMLLGKKFNKSLMWTTLAIIVAYPLPIWSSIILDHTELVSILTTVSYSLFVILVALTIGYILYNYNKAVKNIDNFYSDDVQICVKWISKSIKMLISLSIASIFAPIFFIYPRWLRFIFMMYGFLCYIHIYYGYRQMLINLSEKLFLKEQNLTNFLIVEQNRDTATLLSAETVRNIQTHLDIWLTTKEYCQSNLTINTVAREIKTNRTYLSKYINATYNCSFKKWITQLRIEEAKNLLLSDIDSQINTIVDKIGFASVDSFTHVFTRLEQVPPAKWREERIKLRNE